MNVSLSIPPEVAENELLHTFNIYRLCLFVDKVFKNHYFTRSPAHDVYREQWSFIPQNSWHTLAILNNEVLPHIIPNTRCLSWTMTYFPTKSPAHRAKPEHWGIITHYRREWGPKTLYLSWTMRYYATKSATQNSILSTVSWQKGITWFKFIVLWNITTIF